MVWWLAALWLAVAAGPLLPDLPATQIVYLGRNGAVWAQRPDGIAGLDRVAADRAVAVLFKGGFDFGGTDALTGALDAAPQVRLVAFDSPGGRPLVADGIARLIRERHLDTTVEAGCASACTIAYVAGTLRTAGPRARFGFHLGTGPFMAELAATVVLQIERRWFVRGGASLSFAERALHAPNPQPYFAPLEELQAAGYVHRVLGRARPVASTNPLLASVAAIEPQTGDALATVAARMRPGMTRERAEAVAEQFASLVVDRWLPHSSLAAVLGLIDATLAALDWFAAHDAPACMRWQIGRDDQELSLLMLPAELRGHLQAAQRRVLEDANAYPLPLPADDGALAAADSAVRRDVAAAFGPHALADAASPEHGFDDPARSCAAGIAYLRGLRQRPQAARLLQWALGAA